MLELTFQHCLTYSNIILTSFLQYILKFRCKFTIRVNILKDTNGHMCILFFLPTYPLCIAFRCQTSVPPTTVKLQFSGLGWSAAKGPLFWSCPLFLDLFMYYFLKMVTEKSPVKWSYPLFLESAKLEFYCTCTSSAAHCNVIAEMQD